MELRDYLRVVRRRWRSVITCVAVLVAAAVVVTWNMTPQYASSAQLLVSATSRQDAQAYQGAQFSDLVTSYAELATGQDMALRVIRALNLDMSPAELADKIRAEATPNTAIITLTATDPSPARAQQLAQVYAEQLSQYVELLAAQSGGQPAPVKATIADSPPLPTKPVSPRPKLNIGLGLAIGILLGLGLAVVREMLDTSIKTGQDVSEVVDTSLMATIAFDPAASDRPLVTQLASDAPRVEAFRVLRTNMQFIDVDGDNKVFVVSSPMPGEGKTSTATNLAIALSEAGQRVLLVEADLRQPNVADNLNVERAVGLTSVLVGRISLESALQHPDDIPGLAVLTSGTLPPNPSELLQSNAMTELITTLRAGFDVIIIDTPPLLPVIDAALVAAISDGALLVVRHAKTTRDQLADAIGRLEVVGVKRLGVVLNMAPRGRSQSYGLRHDHGRGRRVRGEGVERRRVGTPKAANSALTGGAHRESDVGVSTGPGPGATVSSASSDQVGAGASRPLSQAVIPNRLDSRQGEGSPSSNGR